jgi:ribosomal protein L27
MSEHLTQQQILLAHGSGTTRLWRNNVGTGWAGQATKVTPGNRQAIAAGIRPGDIIIRQGRPLHAGLCVGSSDLIGYRQVDGVAQFVALEVKAATGRATKEQSQFLEHITAAGGCAGVVRSVEDADLVLGAAIAPR